MYVLLDDNENHDIKISIFLFPDIFLKGFILDSSYLLYPYRAGQPKHGLWAGSGPQGHVIQPVELRIDLTIELCRKG